MLQPISEFDSYRDLLKAVLESEKKHFATPHKAMAESLGLSASLLSMILEGKRHLTFANLQKLAIKLKCSDAEFAYLEAILLHDNSKTNEEKSFYSKRLKQLRGEIRVVPIRTAALPKISNWHILPLFVYITDFAKARSVEDLYIECKHLCTIFEISQEQLHIDLELLHSLEVLNFSEHEKVHLRFDKLTGEFSQIKFMQSLISRALMSVPTHFSRSDAHFSAEAISLTELQSKAFHQRYKELVSEFVSNETEQNQTPKILMISLQMIPLDI